MLEMLSVPLMFSIFVTIHALSTMRITKYEKRLEFFKTLRQNENRNFIILDMGDTIRVKRKG